MSDFLSRHAVAVHSGNLDAIAELYTDDARLITLTGVHDGADGVRARFEDFFDYHGQIDPVEVHVEQVTDDGQAFALYAFTSERGRFEILNAFVLDGDRCRLHFSNDTSVELDRDEVVGG